MVCSSGRRMGTSRSGNARAARAKAQSSAAIALVEFEHFLELEIVLPLEHQNAVFWIDSGADTDLHHVPEGVQQVRRAPELEAVAAALDEPAR